MASKGESSPLTLLNQGKETSLAFTKPIADGRGASNASQSVQESRFAGSSLGEQLLNRL